MGLFSDFKRYDGYTGNVPQRFYDANLPTCPLCGTRDPYWTLRNKTELTATRVQCKCKNCGGVLSATTADFTGLSKSKVASVMTTGGLINALSKKNKGQEVETTYIRIDDLGQSEVSQDLLGKELPLEQIQAMGKAFDILSE